MLKILLVIATTLLLLACGKTVLAKKGDKHIWLNVHHNYFEDTLHWREYEIDTFRIYFGKYDLVKHQGSKYNRDIFNNWYGDPLGPIVAVWEVTRYLGEEPSFKECIKPDDPIEIAKKYGLGSPEYIKVEKSYKDSRKKYYHCIDDNEAIKQKSKTITYYYARSTNNYLPKLPKRPQNHALYDIQISFGPMGGIVERGLTEKEKANKDQLYSEPCHRYGKDDTCYRLAGEDSHLYYTARSVLKKEQATDGKASSSWKQTKFIREEPHKWEEIEGIEITKAQYDYMQTRCEGVFSCYLDDKAPELTDKQREYIKATAWDIDTDDKARDALIKKAEKYRADKQ